MKRYSHSSGTTPAICFDSIDQNGLVLQYFNQRRIFIELHIIIHQVKSWLRTIPTHVSRIHIEKFFNEYSYRINRSQAKENIWHNTILRMLKHMPVTQNQITQKLSV